MILLLCARIRNSSKNKKTSARIGSTKRNFTLNAIGEGQKKEEKAMTEAKAG